MQAFGAMPSEIRALPLQLAFESISRHRFCSAECRMGSGNDKWDMRCALRPIYAASGCVANGHCSPATPSQLTGNYRPKPVAHPSTKGCRKAAAQATKNGTITASNSMKRKHQSTTRVVSDACSSSLMSEDSVETVGKDQVVEVAAGKQQRSCQPQWIVATHSESPCHSCC
jgi:hypothetical protein